MSHAIQSSRAAEDAAPAAPQNLPKDPIAENSLNAEPDILSAKQRMAIELLLVGKSLSQVAAECGVNRRTLYDWRHEDPDFLAELKARRRELWGDLADQLRALLPRALSELAQRLDHRYDRARLDAAKTILRLADVRGTLARAGRADRAGRAGRARRADEEPDDAPR